MVNDKPALSFVIPFYKKSFSTFQKCLESLKTQSLKDFEVVVVKDGPDDTLDAVIASFTPEFIEKTSVIEIPHGGACAARNAGFEASKGRFIVFWDADCFIEPEVAEHWVNTFDKYPEYGFIYSGYRFEDEGGSAPSECFDPWLLRVNNYISGCFPIRRELVVKWDEALESLQDWDFWLRVVENGAKGKFMDGYQFVTEAPTGESISAKGCTPENWLKRMDCVRKKHSIPDRKICVSGTAAKLDSINMAKMIDADYRDLPEVHPHRYETIIKVGFNMNPAAVKLEAMQLSGKTAKNKILFWLPEDICLIYNRLAFNAIRKYSILLNGICQQFCEDEQAKTLLNHAGFKAEVLQLPMKAMGEVAPMPESPRWLVCHENLYAGLLGVIQDALPDIRMDVIGEPADINDYTGIVHFFSDKSLSSQAKRALIAGRHVVTNINAIGCHTIEDAKDPDIVIPKIVGAIRAASCGQTNQAGAEYWRAKLSGESFKERINEKIGNLCHPVA